MEDTVTIIIVDDEQQARSTLQKLLRIHCTNIQLLGMASTIAQAQKLLAASPPDLLLLDINLGKHSGFDLLNSLGEQNFHLVFTTAYDEFALKAFKYHAIDYLLKPIDPDALTHVINRVRREKKQLAFQQIKSLLESMHTHTFDRIAISTSEGISFLLLHEIIRLESDRSYTTFYTTRGKKLTVSKNLKEFEQLLPTDQFFRVHQSHIINIKQVSMILKRDGGYLLMSDQAELPISRRRKQLLLELLNRNSLNY
ncbi:MAG: LytTR family DNA-binding domain-containing protein [Bacteroidota bacterium]